MEIYEAISDFAAEFPDVNSRVLTVSQGERFEVLESNNETRHHQEWWGVRNLLNGHLGYVPARYLKFAERIPEEALPFEHQAERERQLKQLDTMQQEGDAPLPDIYKVPPVQVQSFDEWTNQEDEREEFDGPPRAGSPYREQIPHAHYAGSSGVVLRNKQEKTKSVKPRKSFIDRLFGSKHKDKESKKEKKKGKAHRHVSDHILKEGPHETENDMDFPEPPEPEIDYHDEGHNENDVPNGLARIIQPALGSLEDLPKHLKPASSSENLVEPKKLPNPVVSSKLHQDLHREMESNRRMGVDVLKKKTELKKEFDRREDQKKKKEREEYEKKKKTEIEKRLEEQKQKYEGNDTTAEKEKEKPAPEPTDAGLAEFQRIRTKIYNKSS